MGILEELNIDIKEVARKFNTIQNEIRERLVKLLNLRRDMKGEQMKGVLTYKWTQVENRLQDITYTIDGKVIKGYDYQDEFDYFCNLGSDFDYKFAESFIDVNKTIKKSFHL